MNVRGWALPFRIGATSYVIADDLLPNARFLARYVQDMQLVLFDVPGGASNVPAPDLVMELATHGAANDLTYTVHLMKDLGVTAGETTPLESARRLIDLTRPLQPWAYVGHLDGRSVGSQVASPRQLAAWQAETAEVVHQVAAWCDDPAQLAVENLEGYAGEFVTPVVVRTQVGRCVDVGHLWLDGRDPVVHLRAAWSRLRVVHLHGVSERDHASLAHVPQQRLDAVVHFLLREQYNGVVTLEVFGEEDFWSSLHALRASVDRFQPGQ